MHDELNAPYVLSSDQIAFYRGNGFVKLKGVFTPELLAHYGREIRHKVAELNTQHLPVNQRAGAYDRAFLQIMNIWTKSDTVREFIMGKRLGRIAAELMGSKGVRIYHDQALYKEPGGGITPWHADQYYWPVSSDRTTTAWIPLQPVPMEMGPLAFSPESFKIQQGRDLEIGEESEDRIRTTLKDYSIFEEPFELGEVSFHSGWTFHRAGANTTDRAREVMTVIYMDDEMRLVEPMNKDQRNDRERWCPGVELEAVIDSHLNPLVYRQSS